MQYMLMFRETETDFAHRDDPEEAPTYWGAWMAYIVALNKAGVVVNGAGLHPPHSATMVRMRDGKRHVQDGPYADTKEQLGGYFVIEVPDLDTALDWAARSPSAAYGSTEVRPRSAAAGCARGLKMPVPGHHEEARAAADWAARNSYGRLLALLARDWRDLSLAEEALAESFRSALENWPKGGVPTRPEAWLLTTARRLMVDHHRKRAVRADAEPALALLADEYADAETSLFPDERLKLLFVCAHPAIDAAARAPLMLQTVLGLDAVRIAQAFLTSPAALGQRLVRAKAKIRDAHMAFAVPERSELPERLDAVLQAIYAAYGSGWDDIAGADPKRHGLAQEALYLARLLTTLMPEEPEARGLLALMLHGEARREARRDADGAFIPLAEQDTARWSPLMIGEAERELAHASQLAKIGPFQLEAAIQSVHAARAVTGRTDVAALALLYEGLAQLAPTTGIRVSRAAAIAEAAGAQAGLAALGGLAAAEIVSYQPYWALRAHLLSRAGHGSEAREAYSRAIGLSDDPAVRAFLMRASSRVLP